MQIYKLSDEVREKKSCEAVFVITDLKQGVKNPTRVNVFVNNKFAFSLDVAQIVDYKLKIGKEISDDERKELEKASEFGKLYQRTLEWVLVRPRSEKEVNDYLYKKIYEKKLANDYVDLIINKLKEKKYLNDFEFAKWYVENRFVKKGVSQKRLKTELVKKGINSEAIDEALTMRDDEKEILKIIAKKRAKYDDEKLVNYLCRQGFSFELARNLVQTYEKD